MKKYRFGLGLILGLGVITAIAGVKYFIETTQAKSAINFTTMKTVDKDFAKCAVRNGSDQKISIEIIDSKFTTGTYYVSPQDRAILNCGDKIAIHVAGAVEKLKLSQTITVQTVQTREKIKGREI
jgi:hypothetical protein